MPLIGNQSVLHKSPARFLNGGHAILRANFNKAGMSEGRFDQFSKLSAQPSGYQPGQGAWVLPRVSGGISSTNNAAIGLDASGVGAMGKAASGTASVTFSLSGIGGLISSAAGAASITLSAAGALYASKQATGAATLTLTANGQLSGKGHCGGTAAVALNATWAPYAVGWLSGTTESAGLTPTGIAQAVWARAIEAGFTAEQIVRLIAAHAAGGASDLEGANPSFKGLDGTTTRIAGTYVAGERTVTTLNGD